MRVTKSKVYVIGLFLCLFITMQAQQNIVCSGNNLVQQQGSVSFSIGQIDYVTQIGPTGMVTQGVQQPFEISTLSGQEFTNITTNFSIYPNPTVSLITISITNISIDNLNYEVFDIMGKKIFSNPIIKRDTIINLEVLPKATYILKIASSSKELKTFKIIKN